MTKTSASKGKPLDNARRARIQETRAKKEGKK